MDRWFSNSEECALSNYIVATGTICDALSSLAGVLSSDSIESALNLVIGIHEMLKMVSHQQ